MKASQAIISRLLANLKDFPKYRGRLSAEYFTDQKEATVFNAICAEFEGEAATSFLSLSKRLKAKGIGFEEVASYQEQPQSIGVTFDSLHRQLLEDFQNVQAGEIADWVKRGRITPKEAAIALEEVAGIVVEEKAETLETFTGEAVENMQARVLAFREGRDLPGMVYSDLKTLDQNSLFELGKSVGIGARPAMGKSTLTRTLAANFAKRGIPVLLFSLEMSVPEITNLFICSEARIDSLKWRQGRLSDREIKEFHKAAKVIASLPIQIESIGELSDYKRIVHNWAKIGAGKGVVITDYVQQLSDSSQRHGRKDLELGEISKQMLMLCKRYNYCNVPIFQLSRSVETRGGDKRPILSDLREGGTFEQDLNKALFLYRPEYYGFETDSEGNSTAGIAEIIVAKNREGFTGALPLRFYGAQGFFADIDATPFAPQQSSDGVVLPPISRNQADEVPF